jgi:hypothetical protein
MAVDSSRHYRGPGLGGESIWNCPACGAENAGPLSQGCQLCGSGKPGYRAEAAPPPPSAPPPAAPPATPRPEPVAPAEGDTEDNNVFTRWRDAHPGASIEDAFTAGYLAGFQQARRELTAPPPAASPLDIINRTMIAALLVFRDQVLVHDPEEVATGEWLDANAVTDLIARLSQSRAA